MNTKVKLMFKICGPNYFLNDSNLNKNVTSTTNVIVCNLIHTVVHSLQSGDSCVSKPATIAGDREFPDLILKDV